MRNYMPRVLAVLSSLKIKHERSKVATPGSAASSQVFLKFTSLDGEQNMRYIVPDMDRLLATPKFFIIGFFSEVAQVSSVERQIWNMDDKLVARVFNFEEILLYVTCKKDDDTYFNYVFLKNAEAVDKWRNMRIHDSAVALSPMHYNYVRINHAVLDSSMEKMMNDTRQIQKLHIVRTKYLAYRNGELVWEGMRKLQNDELFNSAPLYHEARPLLFASFVGHNAEPFVDLVHHIGKATGLPVKMVNIVALAGGRYTSDKDLMVKHKIDFAFTRAVPDMAAANHPVPLVAPISSLKRRDMDAVLTMEMLQDAGIYLAPPFVASPWVALADQKAVARALVRLHAGNPLLTKIDVTNYMPVRPENYMGYADMFSHM